MLDTAITSGRTLIQKVFHYQTIYTNNRFQPSTPVQSAGLKSNENDIIVIETEPAGAETMWIQFLCSQTFVKNIWHPKHTTSL